MGSEMCIRDSRNWASGEKRSGILKAVLGAENRLAVNFSPASGDYFKHDELVLNVAYLGMGVETDVKRGENAGRLLKNDFVVMQHEQHKVDAEPQKWRLQVKDVPQMGQKQTAVAIWLSDPETQKIVQAAGGYL